MKKVTTTNKVLAALLVGATIVTLTGCSDNSQQGKIKSLQTELDKYKADEALQDKRLAVFVTLDFDFYSNQKWNMSNHSMPTTLRCIIPMAASQQVYIRSTLTNLHPCLLLLLTQK